jgi:hypothetical protein
VNVTEGDKKYLIGSLIYDFVEKQVGEEYAPKIVGMLIDLPMKDLYEFIATYEKLSAKVQEARKLIVSDEVVDAGQP